MPPSEILSHLRTIHKSRMSGVTAAERQTGEHDVH